MSRRARVRGMCSWADSAEEVCCHRYRGSSSWRSSGPPRISEQRISKRLSSYTRTPRTQSTLFPSLPLFPHTSPADRYILSHRREKLRTPYIPARRTRHPLHKHTQGNPIRTYASDLPTRATERPGEWVRPALRRARIARERGTDEVVGSGKSNTFGVSYVPREDDGSVEPPPSVEELVEHGNSVWEVRPPSQLTYVLANQCHCDAVLRYAWFRGCSSTWSRRAWMLLEGKKIDQSKKCWIY